MRWTITYGMMTCSLVGTFATMICGTPQFVNDWLNPARDTTACSSTVITPMLPKIAVAKPAPPMQALAAVPVETQAVKARMIDAGATREQVLATLGQPSKLDNNRWMYGSQMIMFKDDRVTGFVNVDMDQAARNFEAKVGGSKTGAIGSSGKVAARSRSDKRNTPSKARGYRSPKSATLWEPMFRKFYSDSPMPRSQRHWNRYNSRPGYRDHLYSESNSIYRRR